MHEQSIARALLAQVLRIAEDSGAQAVESLRVRAGEFSGVETLLLASAFELVSVDTIASSARLEVESVPLALQCRECDHHCQPAGLRFQCAACGSVQVRITAGEELILESVNLTIADAEGYGSPKPLPAHERRLNDTGHGTTSEKAFRCL
jgi:hydrogenase nickel incorporation protein HypA/HybF